MADFVVRRSMRRHDPGLVAVRRVRSMNEEKARQALQIAVAGLNRYVGQRAELQGQLGQTDAAIEGPIQHVLGARAAIERIMDAIRYTDERIIEANRVVDQHRVVWEGRKTELSAVERLLENREARRQAERDRKEVRELDDIASQGWLRQQIAREAGAA